MNVVQLVCLVVASVLLIWSLASFIPWLVRFIKAKKDKKRGVDPGKGEEQ